MRGWSFQAHKSSLMQLAGLVLIYILGIFFSLREVAKTIIETFFYEELRSLLKRIEETKEGSIFSKQPNAANLAISAYCKTFVLL